MLWIMLLCCQGDSSSEINLLNLCGAGKRDKSNQYVFTWANWPQTFLSTGGLPGEGSLVQQCPVSLDQIIPAEQLAVLQPALRFRLQTQADLFQASGFLVFTDLIVHLGDGVFDQPQTLDQRPVLVCVSWKEYKIYYIDQSLNFMKTFYTWDHPSQHLCHQRR